MLSYKNIKNDRQWKATIGLSRKSFEKLNEEFIKNYIAIHGIPLNELSDNLHISLLLPTYLDCLFFVLFQLKNGLSYDSLGLLINTDGSNAQRNFEKYLYVLETSLTNMGFMPKRVFKDLAEFEAYFASESELIVDVTEHSTQRPEGNERQKDAYSGKKSNIHTKN